MIEPELRAYPSAKEKVGQRSHAQSEVNLVFPSTLAGETVKTCAAALCAVPSVLAGHWLFFILPSRTKSGSARSLLKL